MSCPSTYSTERDYDSSGKFTEKCMTNDLDKNPSDNNLFHEPVQDVLGRYTFLWPVSCSITESGK